jgi:hypothetical protein
MSFSEDKGFSGESKQPKPRLLRRFKELRLVHRLSYCRFIVGGTACGWLVGLFSGAIAGIQIGLLHSQNSQVISRSTGEGALFGSIGGGFCGCLFGVISYVIATFIMRGKSHNDEWKKGDCSRRVVPPSTSTDPTDPENKIGSSDFPVGNL